ncbi:Putative L-lactate dehydrogenase operon regulatory protein [Pseudooceanicola marinus]|uniref:Putative L-lactate dehydrogenase operon regulatory protein n=1 Tax=Pseudooceanicola marinus TaxID=396013 RepID=A0A1X6ZMX4_9RHOB|nr:GntR family transcriptional regulator [Pseudooceanicola marinus]PJE31582.1 FadR family transcriptional regulator [Pseudooceanicola marinus]SLN54118.1 Putative L-lactate dehydrogenase operon regulatory protein [Pseudooceanicola marinus]
MSVKFGQVVTVGLARQVADEIHAAILDGRLKADDRLPGEEELATRFGVSRPTVREALKRLAALNLIHSRRGPTGGNFVKRPELEELVETQATSAMLMVGMGAFDIDELIEARLETEALCLERACDLRTEEDLAAMRAALARQADPTLLDTEFCAADVGFHRAIVEAAHNAPLRLMMTTVIESFIPLLNMIVVGQRNRADTLAHQQNLLEAVEARDAQRARLALERLLSHLTDTYAAAQRARDAKRPV